MTVDGKLSMTKMTKPKTAKLSQFCDNINKGEEWLCKELKMSQRTYYRYLDAAKSLSFVPTKGMIELPLAKVQAQIHAQATPPVEEPIEPVLRSCSTEAVEAEVIRLYNNSSDKDRRSMLKSILDIWKYKHKVPDHGDAEEESDLEVFLDD